MVLENMEKSKIRAIRAVNVDGYLLKDYPEFQDDKNVVLEAVRNESLARGDKYAFMYASKRLQEDREVVLEAVSHAGLVLEKVNPVFKKDKIIVYLGFKDEATSFRYADESLKDDVEYVSLLVETNAKAVKYASERIRSNSKIISDLMKIDQKVLKYATDEVQTQLKNSKKR